MKNPSRVVLVFAGVLLSPGCIETQPPAQRPAIVKKQIPAMTCPTFPEVTARQALLMFIDRSGSVHDGAQERIRQIRDDAVQVVQQLPPATVVFVRFISAQSYDDKELYLSDAVPEAPAPVECRVTNPFDPRQKRHCHQEQLRYEAQLQCLETARQRILTALQKLAPARAAFTDIFGAVAVAEETFRVYPPTVHRTVVMYSDLNNNVKSQFPAHLPGLQGARVIVRVARTGDPVTPARLLAAFEKRLVYTPASVSSIPLGVPLPDLFGSTIATR